ncbi:hypothetical protein [Paenibacillus sp. GXUN7292]|uniref:hypothetical protein n=1 Tax=Paenibacillus sp. GXUN7292 TaxID=3422499 RepID=UPI003D7D7B2B
MYIPLMLVGAAVLVGIGLFFWYLNNSYSRRNLESENLDLQLRIDLLRGFAEDVTLRQVSRIPVNESTYVQQNPQGTPSKEAAAEKEKNQRPEVPKTANKPDSQKGADKGSAAKGEKKPASKTGNADSKQAGAVKGGTTGANDSQKRDRKGSVSGDSDLIVLTGNMTVMELERQRKLQSQAAGDSGKNSPVDEGKNDQEQALPAPQMLPQNADSDSDKNTPIAGGGSDQEQTPPAPRKKMRELKRAEMPSFEFLRKIRYAGNRSQSEAQEPGLNAGNTESESIPIPPNSTVETTYDNTVVDEQDLVAAMEPPKLVGASDDESNEVEHEESRADDAYDEEFEQQPPMSAVEVKPYPWVTGSNIVRIRVVEQYDGVTECSILGYNTITFLQHLDLDALEVGGLAAVHVSSSKTGIREVVKVWPLATEESHFDEEMLEQVGG